MDYRYRYSLNFKYETSNGTEGTLYNRTSSGKKTSYRPNGLRQSFSHIDLLKMSHTTI
jgi:hypothetical protein